GRRFSRGRPAHPGTFALYQVSHPALARLYRPDDAPPGLGRGRHECPAHRGRDAPLLPRVTLARVPVACGRRPALPRFPMGRAVARIGAAGNPHRPDDSLAGLGPARAVAGAGLADPLAGLPADVRVGHGQADQRRPDLAPLEGTYIPLRDATAA